MAPVWVMDGSFSTVKLILKDSASLADDTVTVAVYIPTGNPVCGRTSNDLLLPAEMLFSDVADNENEPSFAPDKDMVKRPVAARPELITITVLAGGADEYPTKALGKMYVPVSLRDMLLYITTVAVASILALIHASTVLLNGVLLSFQSTPSKLRFCIYELPVITGRY